MSIRFVRTGTTAVTDHNYLANKGIHTHDELDEYVEDIEVSKGDFSTLTERLLYLGTKVVVFVVQQIDDIGEQGIDIRFPFKGEVQEVSASCTIPPSSGNLVITVEKCLNADYVSTPVWVNILSTPLTIENSERTSQSATPPVIDGSVKQLSIGDHLRINIISGDIETEGLVVEVSVKI